MRCAQGPWLQGPRHEAGGDVLMVEGDSASAEEAVAEVVMTAMRGEERTGADGRKRGKVGPGFVETVACTRVGRL